MAERGDIRAALLLGRMYASGTGTPAPRRAGRRASPAEPDAQAWIGFRFLFRDDFPGVDEAEALDWITQTLWSGPWGIFAVADASLEELRRHFRRFLLVHSPEGEQMYFRYYDPRVLAGFLPLCAGAEALELFGPVTSYGIASQDAPVVTLIQRPTASQRLRIRRVEKPSSHDMRRVDVPDSTKRL
ncbi:MAG TPA: DUF4123 domain-containing protein [Longimicrobiaceae bacterium]|jgi:hypothetical protein|nr:DUF4123 domain-containing protein [Longimicrobiaceae bacterium]